MIQDKSRLFSLIHKKVTRLDYSKKNCTTKDVGNQLTQNWKKSQFRQAAGVALSLFTKVQYGYQIHFLNFLLKLTELKMHLALPGWLSSGIEWVFYVKLSKSGSRTNIAYRRVYYCMLHSCDIVKWIFLRKAGSKMVSATSMILGRFQLNRNH